MDRSLLLNGVPLLRQTLNRTAFADALQAARLFREVVVDASGYFKVDLVAWDTYWSDSLNAAPDHIRADVDSLRIAWQEYCLSGYNLTLATPYCFQYFALLRRALQENMGEAFLRSLVGFEVLPIRRFHSSRTEAAGIITVRHPAYLLARLSKPRAPDDPKYLPLVCPSPAGSGDARPALYYHYRQLKFETRHNASVLIYPAVALDRRLDSFGCLNVFAGILRSKPDPRGRQRAAAIVDCAVGPFLERGGTTPGKTWSGEISIADLGGGTGVLLSHLCKRLITGFPDALAGRSFSWSIVDLSSRNPARHTTGQLLRSNLSMVQYVQADYKSWVAQEHLRDDSPQWDIALMCRVLNNMSVFSVESTEAYQEIAALGGDTLRHDDATYLPCRCLNKNVRTPDALVCSNANARLRGGRSFQQLSLTDYFRAISRLCHGCDSTLSGRRVFFPLRRLNRESLRLDDGSCRLERLAAISDLVVIEDVDLDADQLYDYLADGGPMCLAASDATDRRRMQLSNLLCVARPELAEKLPGERVW